MSISRKDICTRTYQVHWGVKSIKTTHKNNKSHPNTTTRKSPAKLAFRQRKQRIKRRNTKKQQTKTGPESKQNTHNIDLPWDAVANPLHHSQKRANELNHGIRANMKALACKFAKHMPSCTKKQGYKLFFSVQRLMASARSFNMFPSMLQIRPHRFGGEGVLIGGQQQH